MPQMDNLEQDIKFAREHGLLKNLDQESGGRQVRKEDIKDIKEDLILGVQKYTKLNIQSNYALIRREDEKRNIESRLKELKSRKKALAKTTAVKKQIEKLTEELEELRRKKRKEKKLTQDVKRDMKTYEERYFRYLQSLPDLSPKEREINFENYKLKLGLFSQKLVQEAVEHGYSMEKVSERLNNMQKFNSPFGDLILTGVGFLQVLQRDGSIDTKMLLTGNSPNDDWTKNGVIRLKDNNGAELFYQWMALQSAAFFVGDIINLAKDVVTLKACIKEIENIQKAKALIYKQLESINSEYADRVKTSQLQSVQTNMNTISHQINSLLGEIQKDKDALKKEKDPKIISERKREINEKVKLVSLLSDLKSNEYIKYTLENRKLRKIFNAVFFIPRIIGKVFIVILAPFLKYEYYVGATIWFFGQAPADADRARRSIKQRGRDKREREANKLLYEEMLKNGSLFPINKYSDSNNRSTFDVFNDINYDILKSGLGTLEHIDADKIKIIREFAQSKGQIITDEEIRVLESVGKRILLDTDRQNLETLFKKLGLYNQERGQYRNIYIEEISDKSGSVVLTPGISSPNLDRLKNSVVDIINDLADFLNSEQLALFSIKHEYAKYKFNEAKNYAKGHVKHESKFWKLFNTRPFSEQDEVEIKTIEYLRNNDPAIFNLLMGGDTGRIVSDDAGIDENADIFNAYDALFKEKVAIVKSKHWLNFDVTKSTYREARRKQETVDHVISELVELMKTGFGVIEQADIDNIRRIKISVKDHLIKTSVSDSTLKGFLEQDEEKDFSDDSEFEEMGTEPSTILQHNGGEEMDELVDDTQPLMDRTQPKSNEETEVDISAITSKYTLEQLYNAAENMERYEKLVHLIDAIYAGDASKSGTQVINDFKTARDTGKLEVEAAKIGKIRQDMLRAINVVANESIS